MVRFHPGQYMNLLTNIYSVPKDKNCEVIYCSGEDCDKQTIVLQKDYVIRYTCPDCYEREKK